MKKNNSNLNKYEKYGVTISPVVPTSGGKLTITYNGLLSECGATDVLAHVGFGDKWDCTCDYRMEKTGEGYKATIPIPITQAGTINMCFKDSANNWDNNSGADYVFELAR